MPLRMISGPCSLSNSLHPSKDLEAVKPSVLGGTTNYTNDGPSINISINKVKVLPRI